MRIEADSDKLDKSRLIIDTAQKRFGIYGVEKTSMREIADDLQLSKASLYYYFPDKESLYRAVLEKEQKEFLDMLSEKIISIENPELILLEYVRVRLTYFRKLLNLSRIRSETYLKPVFRDTMLSFRNKEKEMIIKVFRKGIENRQFKDDNPEKTASLFIDLIRGLRISSFSDKAEMFIADEEFRILLDKSIAFTHIFIKGIKTENTINKQN